MSSESRRNCQRQQALLKLEGQKLFAITASGGLLSSFGGLLPVAKIGQASGLLSLAASKIPEWRSPDWVDFNIEELLSQRAFLAACGFPDAIDCSFFKDDPVLKSILLKEPDQRPLASQSTHTRLEQSISEDAIKAIEAFPLEFFFTQHKHAPRALTIYVDGTAIRTFGAQEKSIYRGGDKYKQTQYFPLIATADSGDLLLAQLRKGTDAEACSRPAISNMLLTIKEKWPATKLTVVLDTGFNSPQLLSELEAEGISYIIGYPATSSVKSKIKDLIELVEEEFRAEFGEPLYIGKKGAKAWQKEHERIRLLPTAQRMEAEKKMTARHTRVVWAGLHNGVNWGEDRMVVHRVDYTDKGIDIRCVVTNVEGSLPEVIYEEQYCRRARIEMFIKENKSHCKVPLSCQTFTANQFRLSLIQSLAYMLLHLTRRELPPSKRNISIATVRNNFVLVPVLILSNPRRLLWQLSSVHPASLSVIQLARKLHARTA